MKDFRLIPFNSNTKPDINITGTIDRSDNDLFIRYEISGEIDRIMLPSESTSPVRTHDLWKSTCFEFFIAMKDQPGYWEFNLSPSCDWNVYAMDAYRQVNMREEAALAQLPFRFQKTNARLFLDIAVDLTPIIQTDQVLQIGISAVVQTRDGQEIYWALAHPGTQADFHLRRGFILEM
jgi:hypothetical protein